MGETEQGESKNHIQLIEDYMEKSHDEDQKLSMERLS